MRSPASTSACRPTMPRRSTRRWATSRSRSSGRSSSGVGSTTTPTAETSTFAPDLAPEQLVVPDGLPAFLAVDDRDRRERRATARTAPEQDAAALRALLRQLRLELLEPALRGAARQAEGDPVAQHLPALLAKPIGGLAHTSTVVRLPMRPCPSPRSSLPAPSGPRATTWPERAAGATTRPCSTTARTGSGERRRC